MLLALTAASMLALTGAAHANDTVQDLECASLEHHHGKGMERWERQADRVIPPPISEIEGRFRLQWADITVRTIMEKIYDWKTAYDLSQEQGYLERAKTLRARARKLDCAWAG